MNQRNAKMLRRLNRDNKVGKRMFNLFTQQEKEVIRKDYILRGESTRANYSAAKTLAKKERLGE